ncbi:MAG: hypothetical protein E6R03_12745 [Hyphomicrobiaceae bacterium]|nr:MAG: hypothetical protein E6R03_12745 [Hyphomicrobiaceae bacterium]
MSELWTPEADLDLDWDLILKVASEVLLPPGTQIWEPLPHQIPPETKWMIWMLMGGRGTGKTAPGAKTMDEHMKGPPCAPHMPGGHHAAIIGPTLGDAVTSCIEGESGIRKWEPNIKVRSLPGGTLCIWPNGAVAKVFGAYTPEDVERLRAGGNRCFVWAEEAAAWRYLEEAWDHMRFGLRIGPWPRVICTTTPKPRAKIKELVKESLEPNSAVVITTGTTDDNPHLPEHIRKDLYRKYGGTRLGQQELLGRLLEDNPNALWTYENFELYRIREDSFIPVHFDRIVVGVDPSVIDDENSDETGIIVGGLVRHWNAPPGFTNAMNATLPHAFILDDLSGTYTTHEWGQQVVYAVNKYKANRVVGEINNGGDLVKNNIHVVDASIPFKAVTATRGKSIRAEPVSTVYEQGRVHHVGNLPLLEDQMVSFDPTLDREKEKFSPDRMDALVWLVTDMLVGNIQVTRSKAADTRTKGRR